MVLASRTIQERHKSSKGSVLFYGNATAGSLTNFASLENTTIDFNGASTAGNGTFTNGGYMIFRDTSSASNATITNITGPFSTLNFVGSSTAANSTATSNGATTIGGVFGQVRLDNSASAGNATLIANAGAVSGADGGRIQFTEDSIGGTARVEVFGNGNLDISLHNAPGVAIGSVEGSGAVFLGANKLTVGSRKLSTTFSGIMRDGGPFGGTGGSLAKLGMARSASPPPIRTPAAPP